MKKSAGKKINKIWILKMHIYSIQTLSNKGITVI